MEPYRNCGAEVVAFLDRWDTGLRAAGYRGGAYWNVSNLRDLTRAAGKMAEPAVIDYARWDALPTTTSPYMPARMWISHQRIHQYLGGRAEKWGGVTIDIDRNRLDVRLPSPQAAGAPGP